MDKSKKKETDLWVVSTDAPCHHHLQWVEGVDWTLKDPQYLVSNRLEN